MLNKVANFLSMAVLAAALTACGGGGGGDRAEGVAPGPEAPGGPVTPPPPDFPTYNPAPYADAQELSVFITDVSIPEDGRPVVQWQLTDGNNVAIADLGPRDVRFTLAKLQLNSLGGSTGDWQSYINRIRDPDADDGDGTEPRLQATYERDAGEFTNNEDGTYQYRFDLSVIALETKFLEQAEIEGLDLSYEPERTHRLAMQFGNSEGWANPIYDWVPATGATGNVFAMDISPTAKCNQCHDPLAFHGSGRREVKYCVTCHNRGSTDPSSTNTVDMKVMIHKIHRGADLPSVADGGTYIVGGRDYSNVNYPQDIRNCVNCHAGTATGADADPALTAQGDNWSQYSSRAVCGSCHDDIDWDNHQRGQPDDSKCASCHREEGDAGSIASSHAIVAQEMRAFFKAELGLVSNTGPGQTPEVNFRITDPVSGDDYDILNDPVWTNSSSRLRVRFAWSTTDYTNTGNGEDDANSVATNAVEEALYNGDGSFRVSAPQPIPDGSEAPGIAATGSGAVVIEGRAVVPIDKPGETTRVPLTNVHSFFSIDEPDAEPHPRREIADIVGCQACHVSVSFHGGSRNDSIDSCVTCHNPRNTDREDRLDLDEPPADNKLEESIDFKTMIHGIHASDYRNIPLQIGSRVYDLDRVRYPGNLANCTVCHDGDSFALPLEKTVLGPSNYTGEDLQDPSDDTVTTPATAVCSSCHDSPKAREHMQTVGSGSFNTTQEQIDSGAVTETCDICHASGRDNDASRYHMIN